MASNHFFTPIRDPLFFISKLYNTLLITLLDTTVFNNFIASLKAKHTVLSKNNTEQPKLKKKLMSLLVAVKTVLYFYLCISHPLSVLIGDVRRLLPTGRTLQTGQAVRERRIAG